MVVYDSEGENDANSPVLQQFQPHLGPEPETYSAPSPPQRRRKPVLDPGDAPLIENLGPNNPELARFGQDYSEATSESSPERSPAMVDHAEVVQGPEDQIAESSADRGYDSKSEHPVAEFCGIDDVKTLKAQAAAALEVAPRVEADSHRHAVAKRVDSAQDDVQQLEPEKRPPRSGRNSPLKLRTDQFVSQPDDTIATSPTLRKYAIRVEEGTAGTLPALQPTSPTKDGSASSPRTERLPSFRQLTGQLPELAEAATQHDLRGQQYCHHHSQSFGSAASQTPMLPYHPHPTNVQASPSSQYAYSARSPTSTIGDHLYGSPTQYPGPAYYADRRSSAATENTAPLPASLPSASSSGESHGPASSSTDGYSTNHTTPIDAAIPPDGTPRQMPILPPPAGMPHGAIVIAGSFKCNWPGCISAPFQTQYLLSSHKNVHSQNRPHYCPVKDCPRGDGGKGFKRKNEMIRHGLVHNSPGYICPFCPDREHRYPRPDNLQRHVRVHHVDKDKDDPQLREVLAQRTEGAGKTRRRRTNTNESATSP